MHREFFTNYEYFWEYEYPFGEKFLKEIFNDAYLRKYSLIGDGIFNIVSFNDKIYSIDLKQGKTLLADDGKKAFRDNDKDSIVEAICKKLKENNVNFTVNSGKFITFKYNTFIFKIEIVKKASMPK